VARGLFWADDAGERARARGGVVGSDVRGGSRPGWEWNIWLVLESFRLRTTLVDLTGVEVAAGLKTLLVPRSAGLEGSVGPLGSGPGATVLSSRYALGADVIEQTPADAKSFATDKRLKEWGLWDVATARGSGRGGRVKRGANLGVGDHRKDAMRHLALRVAKILHGARGSAMGGGESVPFDLTLVSDCLNTYAGGPGMETWVVEGDPRVQAWELAAEFGDWVAELRGRPSGIQAGLSGS
jgi:hypothetical protein